MASLQNAAILFIFFIVVFTAGKPCCLEHDLLLDFAPGSLFNAESGVQCKKRHLEHLTLPPLPAALQHGSPDACARRGGPRCC